MTVHAKLIARFIVKDLLGSVAWFPVWWYTTGFMGVVTAMKDSLSLSIKRFGFKIWIKNFFVPMYGQTDLAGKLISVFMRTVVIIGRSIYLAIETVVYGLGVAVWLLAPPTFIALALMSFAKGKLYGA